MLGTIIRPDEAAPETLRDYVLRVGSAMAIAFYRAKRDKLMRDREQGVKAEWFVRKLFEVTYDQSFDDAFSFAIGAIHFYRDHLQFMSQQAEQDLEEIRKIGRIDKPDTAYGTIDGNGFHIPTEEDMEQFFSEVDD